MPQIFSGLAAAMSFLNFMKIANKLLIGSRVLWAHSDPRSRRYLLKVF
jgi:hypothetical protein